MPGRYSGLRRPLSTSGKSLPALPTRPRPSMISINARGLTVGCVRGDAARSVCGAVHLVLSHPQKLGLENAVRSLLPTQCVSKRRYSSLLYRTRRCGLNFLQRLQSAVAFTPGWCPLRRIRTKNERSASSRYYSLRVHKFVA